MENLDAAMSDIKGAHIASIFRSEPDQFKSAVPFILRGLDSKRKCFYISDRHTKDEVIESLMKARDIQSHLDSHQITVLSSGDTYLKGGHFEIDRMLRFWGQLEREAFEEGYSGLMGTGEMTWYSTGMPGVEGIREYEARVNTIYPASGANFLCQYDEMSFDSGMLLDVIRAHPKVVVHGELCVNPYFTPPDELLSFMRGVIPRGIYERTSRDILKRARFTTIHELELRDSRRANRKMAVIGGTALDEVQSQVSVVGFYTELAMDSVRDDATKDYLEKIAKNCASLQKRLDFMRSYQLLNQSEFRWWSLGDLFGRIGARLGSEGIQMEFRTRPVKVWADGLFERALEEMIRNIPDLRGHDDRVLVKSSESRNGILISLEHKGKGLPEELKSRVFECGYRYGSSDGYGLFLALEVFRSAGMSVRETGTCGKETRFEILVPQGKYSIDADSG